MHVNPWLSCDRLRLTPWNGVDVPCDNRLCLYLAEFALINWCDIPVLYLCAGDWVATYDEITYVRHLVDVTGEARYRITTRAERRIKLKIIGGTCIP